MALDVFKAFSARVAAQKVPTLVWAVFLNPNHLPGPAMAWLRDPSHVGYYWHRIEAVDYVPGMGAIYRFYFDDFDTGNKFLIQWG